MLLYCVQWTVSNKLSKGKGKIPKTEDSVIITVLCDHSSDAYRCLVWYMRHKYKSTHKLTLDDGEIKMNRMIIDSRGFSPHYLLLQGMHEPIYLPDPASNAIRSQRIFGLTRSIYGSNTL